MNHRAEQRFHKNLYYTLQSMRGRHVGPFVRRLQAWERLDRASFDHLTRMFLRDALRYAREQVPLYSSGAWQSSLSGTDADEAAAPGPCSNARC